MDSGLDRMDALYRAYLGEPERDLDVYLGFTLFIGGFALAILGLVLFGVEQVLSDGQLWGLLRVAYILAALGLPVLLLGVTVLLPVDPRASYAAGVGLAITIIAAGYFAMIYPQSWNTTTGPDHTLQGILIFAIGLILSIAATGAALVSYHVERTSGVPAQQTAGDDSTTATTTTGDEVDEEAIAEQAQRDYEEAMEDADVTWGGVEKTDVSRRLSVNPSEVDEVDTSGFDTDSATEVRTSNSNVDGAVAGLDAMRGGNADEERTEDTTDDSATALAELREQQAREEERRKKERGLVDSVRDRLGLE